MRATTCEACGQTVKIYDRQIYDDMAKNLVRLYRMSAGYHHIRNIGNPSAGGGDFAKLRYWGLVYPCPDPVDPNKRTNGLWMISDYGKRFVELKVTVPKYAEVYNQQLFGFHGKKITILDAFDSKFDYEELMR